MTLTKKKKKKQWIHKTFHEIVNFCLVLLSETKKHKNIITEIKFLVLSLLMIYKNVCCSRKFNYFANICMKAVTSDNEEQYHKYHLIIWWSLMRIPADNHQWKPRMQPESFKYPTYWSQSIFVLKLPGTKKSVLWFNVTSGMAYIVVRLATIIHDS